NSGSLSGYNASGTVSENKDTDSDIYQNKGYSLIAEIGFRPDYKLLLNFEAGTQFPFKNDKKSLNDDIIEVNNELKSSGVYPVRC
ncbi:MAG TPA: hypothetical protein PKJ75_06860, partial [Methanosarcina vacuolata]|nr:hypothetical protein [Methanosarcina vacuolata]